MGNFLDNLDPLDFLAEEDDEHKKEIKILIADDNEDVHKISGLILADFSYKDYKLSIFHAYSEKETNEFMIKNTDTAIILLDVVMEADDSGLNCVRYIREELKNSFVRIILRTGQPGKAPEDEVIKEYDINNYIAKTEGSIQKIYTALYSAIRSYTDILIIDNSKKGLEQVIEASKELYSYSSLMKFYEGILSQLTNLLEFENNSFIASTDYKFVGAVLIKEDLEEHVLAATGKFAIHINEGIEGLLRDEVVEKIRTQEPGEITFYEDFYLCCWTVGDSEIRNYIYVESDHIIDETTKKIIKLLINNFSLAIANYALNHANGESQKEMIFKLGDVIETRLRDNHNHIYRVSEISAILARANGISEADVEVLKITSTLHDIGKISIPDEILLKPGKLTDEEFDLMKKHTKFGANLVKSGNSKIFKVASDIALYHHEKWNGKGYPQGLKGEEIPLFARIVSVADVFDALAHVRSYKEAWSIEQIIELFNEEKGESFDPEIVGILFKEIDNVREVLKLFPGEREK